MKIIYHSTNKEFINNIVDLISQSAEKAIEVKGKFRIVLTGGETPKLVYQELKLLATNWTAWEFYISDERFAPDSVVLLNQLMIRNEFLNHVPVLESQIHFVDVEKDLNSAVFTYCQSINNIPDFDLTLLGIGEDGHVASLFPGNDIGLHPESPDVLSVNNSPKPPACRISLSMKRLNKSLKIIVIASGKRKRKIVHNLCSGIEVPAMFLKGLEETIFIYCAK
jgi:6-phosphogluconolactonase